MTRRIPPLQKSFDADPTYVVRHLVGTSFWGLRHLVGTTFAPAERDHLVGGLPGSVS